MEFFLSFAGSAKQRTDCAIVGVYDKGTLSAAAEELDKRIGGRIARLVKRGDLRGKPGDVVLLADLTGAPVERVVVVGLGNRAAFKRKQYRKALASALGVVARTGAKDAVSYLGLDGVGDADTYSMTRIAVEVAANSQYRIADHKTTNKRQKPTLSKFGIAVTGRGDRGNAERAIEHGQGIFAGMSLMRDLANEPANFCTPGYLAKAARTLAREHRKIRVRVLNEAECRRLKMGSFLSVTNGSDEPPRFIVLEYRNGARERSPGGAGRQGHHVRHRRHLAQAGRRHGRDEVRHVRRGQRARHVPRGRRARSCRSTWSASIAGLREHAERPRDQAGRHRHEHVRPDRSKCSTPTPKAA